MLSLSAAFADSNIVVSDVWARATPPGARAGAVYAAVENRSAQSLTLESLSGDIAENIELHTHINEDGLMKMRKLESLSISSGSSERFEPGHKHIMLIGLHKALKPGDTFTLEFHFAGSITKQIPVTVR